MPQGLLPVSMPQGLIPVCVLVLNQNVSYHSTKAGHNTELKHALALAKACHSTEEKRVTGVVGSSDPLGKTVSSATLRDTDTHIQMLCWSLELQLAFTPPPGQGVSG